MILNFENYTQPMTKHEIALMPWFAHYLLKYAYGKDNIKTSDSIMVQLKSWNRDNDLNVVGIDKVLIGKMTHHLRASGNIPNICTTSYGFFIGLDEAHIKETVISLNQRANSIISAADGIEWGMNNGNMITKEKYDIGGLMNIQIKMFDMNPVNDKAIEYINLFDSFRKTHDNIPATRKRKVRLNIIKLYPTASKDEIGILCNKKLSEVFDFLRHVDCVYLSIQTIFSLMDIMEGVVNVFLDYENTKNSASNIIKKFEVEIELRKQIKKC